MTIECVYFECDHDSAVSLHMNLDPEFLSSDCVGTFLKLSRSQVRIVCKPAMLFVFSEKVLLS